MLHAAHLLRVRAWAARVHGPPALDLEGPAGHLGITCSSSVRSPTDPQMMHGLIRSSLRHKFPAPRWINASYVSVPITVRALTVIKWKRDPLRRVTGFRVTARGPQALNEILGGGG